MKKINTKIMLGDCGEVLRNLDENSIDLIVTSPPYADSRNGTYRGIKPDGTFILNIKEKVVNGEGSAQKARVE